MPRPTPGLRQIDTAEQQHEFLVAERDFVLFTLGLRPSESSLLQTLVAQLQSAGVSIAAMRLVRITHPFHPLSGKELACVGERYNRYGRRLLLRVDEVDRLLGSAAVDGSRRSRP